MKQMKWVQVNGNTEESEWGPSCKGTIRSETAKKASDCDIMQMLAEGNVIASLLSIT